MDSSRTAYTITNSNSGHLEAWTPSGDSSQIWYAHKYIVSQQTLKGWSKVKVELSSWSFTGPGTVLRGTAAIKIKNIGTNWIPRIPYLYGWDNYNPWVAGWIVFDRIVISNGYDGDVVSEVIDVPAGATTCYACDVYTNSSNWVLKNTATFKISFTK